MTFPLFIENGKAMKFRIIDEASDNRFSSREIVDLILNITSQGGKLDTADSTTLAEPDIICLGKKEMDTRTGPSYLFTYIEDCIKMKKLLPLQNYRIDIPVETSQKNNNQTPEHESPDLSCRSGVAPLENASRLLKPSTLNDSTNSLALSDDSHDTILLSRRCLQSDSDDEELINLEQTLHLSREEFTNADQCHENLPPNGKLSIAVPEKIPTTCQEENKIKEATPRPSKNSNLQNKNETSTDLFSQKNIRRKPLNSITLIDFVDDEDANAPLSKRRAYKNHKTNHQSHFESSSESDADTDVPVPRYIKKEEEDLEEMNLIEDSDDEEPPARQPAAENKCNEKIQWLLQDWSEEKFETKLKENHQEFYKRKFYDWERRGMLWYLITRDVINKARSRQVWREMREEGYLVHRSVSSLLNQFLRGIRPFIDQMRMPPEILAKFNFT